MPWIPRLGQLAKTGTAVSYCFLQSYIKKKPWTHRHWCHRCHPCHPCHPLRRRAGPTNSRCFLESPRGWWTSPSIQMTSWDPLDPWYFWSEHPWILGAKTIHVMSICSHSPPQINRSCRSWLNVHVNYLDDVFAVLSLPFWRVDHLKPCQIRSEWMAIITEEGIQTVCRWFLHICVVWS